MRGTAEGFIVRQVNPGAPVLLAFDGSESPADGFADAEVWEAIARRGDPPAGLILLRDPAGAGYYRGIPGLGDSIDEVAASLRAMIDGLGADGVLAAGSGLGGHAALVFGTLLGARRVVAVEPVAHLIEPELALYNDRRWGRVLAAMPRPSPSRRFDVPALMARQGFDGEARVLFGTGRAGGNPAAVHLNVVHAYWIARHDRVTLHPFPEVRQDLWGELRRRGDLEEVMAHHLFGPAAPSDEGSRNHPAPEAASGRSVVSLFLEAHIDDPGEPVHLYSAAGTGEAPEIRPIDDEMRCWIAENLLIGEPAEFIARRLRKLGFAEARAVEEIRRAAESPYVRGAVLLRNRIKKRDWLLDVHGKLGRLHPDSGAVPRRPGLSRDAFLREHYATGRPVLLAGMIEHGPSGVPWSLDRFAQQFGDRRVFIRRAWTDRDLLAHEQVTRIVTVAECLAILRGPAGSSDFCLTTEDPENREALAGLRDEVGRVPGILGGDGGLDGWFRLDPPGSYRTFRHELNNILVAALAGTTRVKLAPPWELPRMKNATREYSQLDGRKPAPDGPEDPEPPHLIECTIEPGEVLFLPVGWWSFFAWSEVSALVAGDRFPFDNDLATPDATPERM